MEATKKFTQKCADIADVDIKVHESSPIAATNNNHTELEPGSKLALSSCHCPFLQTGVTKFGSRKFGMMNAVGEIKMLYVHQLPGSAS